MSRSSLAPARRLAVFAAGLLAALAWLSMVAPVRGACGLTAEAVAGAEVVFVGGLTGVAGDGTASFEIEEVWRGPGLVEGAIVPVNASMVGLEMPPDGTIFRYLVLAREVDGRLHTGDGSDACARYPFPWDASYAAFGPVEPPPVTTPPSSESGGPVLPFIILLGALGIGLAAFLVGSGRVPGNPRES